MPDTVATHVNSSNFMSGVVEASAQIPVLVDFWAPWCAPCRQLMPLLERLANEYSGRFQLAKVNTEEEQQLAQQLGIRSLPTVVLFKDRTSVDHFVGVVPEAEIRAMLDRHLPRTSDVPLNQVQTLKAQGDFAGAQAALQHLLARNPEDVLLQTEAAELHALDGDVEVARQALRQLQMQEPNHPAVKRLSARITFSDVIAQHPDLRRLRTQAAEHPHDLTLRHALAVHQLLSGDVEPALRTWLDMVSKHREFDDDLARRSLVLAFELIGDADPIVARTRRAMARLLF
jgi:putative thioredoxin